jgi:hypothetical protein
VGRLVRRSTPGRTIGTDTRHLVGAGALIDRIDLEQDPANEDDHKNEYRDRIPVYVLPASWISAVLKQERSAVIQTNSTVSERSGVCTVECHCAFEQRNVVDAGPLRSKE